MNYFGSTDGDATLGRGVTTWAEPTGPLSKILLWTAFAVLFLSAVGTVISAGPVACGGVGLKR